MTPRRPGGPRTAKLPPLSWTPGKPNGVVPYAYRNEAWPSLGAANCEAVASFGGSWRPSGVMPRTDQNDASPSLKRLRTPKPSPRSCVYGSSSGVAPYADQNEASPALGAAKCEAVATFGGSWRPSGVMPRPDQIEASPSLKGLRTAKLSPRSCASGRSSGVTPYADQNESSLSLWTANCESFATLVSF